MKTKIVLGLLFGCTVSLVGSFAGAATIYKWIDENGSVHYSNERPPSHVKAQVIDTSEPVRTEPQTRPVQAPQTPANTQDSDAEQGAPSEAPEPTSREPSLKEREAAFEKRRAARLADEAREAREGQAEQLKMARACERARNSLARTVASPPRLAQKNAKQADVWVYRGDRGEVPSLNNAERTEAIEVLEAFIAKNCAKRNRQ